MTAPRIIAKRRRAIKSALEFVEDGSCIGLGSGMTMSLFITELGGYIKRKDLNATFVSSSSQVDLEAPKHGLNMISFSSRQDLDIVFDSADEVDGKSNMLKGGGAALLREKVLHCAGRKTVIIIEEEKIVKKLGTKHLLPVEVLPFALPLVKKEIEHRLGFVGDVRMSCGKVGPLVTDNGNYILDIHTGLIQDPASLEHTMKSIPGIIETGLFLGLKGVLIIGGEKSVQKVKVEGGSILEKKRR